MNRAGILAVVLAALVAGFAGSFVQQSLLAPVPADAQGNPGAKPLKIALLDLERVARSSRKFKKLKDEWEARQNTLKEENRKMTEEFEEKKAALRRAQARSDASEEVATLRVELAAMEENIKTTREVQKRYLSELLENYQKEVLEDVLGRAQEYCIRQGYHLVLQNYDNPKKDDDMFTGSSFAERVMSKPVLFAPGTVDRSNPYVVDITDALLD
ncbi:MAG: OmpH family outer membrane protein [Planctomycetes bacterium]|nr:OmpH family outer membrane protein [Planctomycetota bacterium]